MNRIGPMIAPAALLLLASCGGNDGKNRATSADTHNATANATATAVSAPVTQDVKGAVRFQPGEWANSIEFTNFYAPGIKDARIAGQMREVFERQITSYKNRCMTPEEAVSPSARMFTDAADSGTCSYDRFTMQDGKMDAALSCIRDDGKPGPAMIVEGRYTPTSFDLRTITQMPNFASPRNPPMMVTAHVIAHRVGPCGK